MGMVEPGSTDGKSGQVLDLMPWDITVRSASLRRQACELLDRPDADRAIQALSELEIYYVIKDLGLEDSGAFLSVIEPEKIQALIDLDVWHGERVDLDDLLTWLVSFKEASTERLSIAARVLDPELLALLLRRRLLVAARLPEDQETDLPSWVLEPDESILPLVETPDRRFFIAARTEDPGGAEEEPKQIDEEDRKALLELINDLYRDEDFEFVSSLLRMAETDLDAALEDTARRFRESRLEDLGFPPAERAMEVYGPLDPDRALAAPEPRFDPTEMRLPAIHASRISDGLLRDALRAIEDPVRVRAIESELLPLANAVMVADRVEPGDLERIRDVLDRLRAYLELALTHGVGPEPIVEVARRRLETCSLRTLFRAGYTITLKLATSARALIERGAFRVGADPLGLLEEVDRGAVEALLTRRPMCSTGLEGARPPGTRPFRTPADVKRVRGALDELAALAAAAEALGLGAASLALGEGVEPPLPGERSLDLLLTTATARAILGEPFAPVPLDRVALDALAAQVVGRGFPEAAVARAVAAAEATSGAAPGSALGQRLRRNLRDLGDALAPFTGRHDLDPRFIGGVVRRLH